MGVSTYISYRLPCCRVFIGYSWGIHGIFICIGYVSVMYRLCIGYVSEYTMSEQKKEEYDYPLRWYEKQKSRFTKRLFFLVAEGGIEPPTFRL